MNDPHYLDDSYGGDGSADDLDWRLSALLAGGADRPIAAGAVIAGARRRRARHRTAVAASSLAVLGVAAGATAAAAGRLPGTAARPVSVAAASPATGNSGLGRSAVARKYRLLERIPFGART